MGQPEEAFGCRWRPEFVRRLTKSAGFSMEGKGKRAPVAVVASGFRGREKDGDYFRDHRIVFRSDH
jgi:hypothetical protein